jgi:hypothetical protein
MSEKKFTARQFTEYHVKNFGNMDIWAEDVSDGYHTFDELYQHRHALFIALCKIYDNYITPLQTRVKCWKSKLHHDGSMFEGQFILGMTITEFTGPMKEISYHLPLNLWTKINVIQLKNAPPYSGYTSDDVVRRLLEL